DATSGFNACTFCGFENFKRHAFCHLCDSELPKAAQATATNKKARGYVSVPSTAPLVVDAEVPAGATMREKRARRRKYWTRKIDVDGSLYWYRAPPVKGLRIRDSYGYAMRFVRDPLAPFSDELVALCVSRPATTAVATPECGTSDPASARTEWRLEIVVLPPEQNPAALAAGSRDPESQQARARPSEPSSPPVVYSKDVVAQHLCLETSFQTLVLAEASEADPADAPVLARDERGRTTEATKPKTRERRIQVREHGRADLLPQPALGARHRRQSSPVLLSGWSPRGARAARG
ncbi:hypothetical protein PybrP1_006176, partial [[Pythium] brassicae (nom. inval.)]